MVNLIELIVLLCNISNGNIVSFVSCEQDDPNENNNNTSVTDGITINGVTWATCNVDVPGTFIDKPSDFGMFYQWNRTMGSAFSCGERGYIDLPACPPQRSRRGCFKSPSWRT
ncbi:MAG: hypothetical protein LBR51_00445 [Bacteroidales bacterium]|nr:hypothetical protein [Bacteroidales bacterium]